jgi:hypothetical protein
LPSKLRNEFKVAIETGTESKKEALRCQVTKSMKVPETERKLNIQNSSKLVE